MVNKFFSYKKALNNYQMDNPYFPINVEVFVLWENYHWSVFCHGRETISRLAGTEPQWFVASGYYYSDFAPNKGQHFCKIFCKQLNKPKEHKIRPAWEFQELVASEVKEGSDNEGRHLHQMEYVDSHIPHLLFHFVHGCKKSKVAVINSNNCNLICFLSFFLSLSLSFVFNFYPIYVIVE